MITTIPHPIVGVVEYTAHCVVIFVQPPLGDKASNLS